MRREVREILPLSPLLIRHLLQPAAPVPSVCGVRTGKEEKPPELRNISIDLIMYQYLLCQDTHNNYNKTQCAKLLEKHTDWFPSIPVSQIDTSFKEANYDDANRTIEALIYCARDLEAWEKTPGELDGSERFPRGNQDLVKVCKHQVLL